MNISSADLADLIREIEAEDPIDFSDLPYDEENLRLLVCNQVREIADLAAPLGEKNYQVALLAITAKLVLENLVLQVRLMRAQGREVDERCEALFRRLRGGHG